jgi:hypothetical protein
MVMSWKGLSSGSRLKVVRIGPCCTLLLSLLGSVYWLLLRTEVPADAPPGSMASL